MNRRAIKSVLGKAHKAWIKSIKNEEVRELANKNSFITGGAIVSLLGGETPNDYDIYFSDYETTFKVARYYQEIWNESKKKNVTVVGDEENNRVSFLIASEGVASTSEKLEGEYQPRFFSDNALTLSDGIQLIVRFIGTPAEVHKNFDFVHCFNYYVPSKHELVLNQEALESFIFKQLKYKGSLYPVASIIRSRKFIERGWKISAGEYLKMAFQVGELDFKDPKVLADQLNGVDILYMNDVVEAIREAVGSDNPPEINATYLCNVVEKIFDKEEYDVKLDVEDGLAEGDTE